MNTQNGPTARDDVTAPSTVTRRHYGRYIEGGLWLVLCSTAWGLSFSFDDPLPSFKYGAALWPRVIILLIAICAIVGMAVPSRVIGGSVDNGQSRQSPRERSSVVRRLSIFLIPILYIWLLPRIGHVVASPIFILVTMLALGERSPTRAVLTTIGAMTFIFLVFTKIFYVPLPQGTWPGFREVNTAFIAAVR